MIHLRTFTQPLSLQPRRLFSTLIARMGSRRVRFGGTSTSTVMISKRLRCVFGGCANIIFPSSSGAIASRNNRSSSVLRMGELQLARHASSSSDYKGNSPYEILQVPRSASDAEIKLAYYKLAKTHHPDLHRSDPPAEQERCKQRFQQLSAAYDCIKTQEDRDKYAQSEMNAAGSGNEEAWSWDGSSKSSSSTEPHRHKSYEDMFASVMRDSTVIKEAMQSVVKDLQDELVFAVECGQRGDWKTVRMVLRENSLLIGGVVIPLIVLVRFPAAIAVIVRLVVMASTNVIRLMLQNSGNFAAVSVGAFMLWERIVQLSRMQKIRSQRRADVRAEHARRSEQEAAEQRAEAETSEAERKASRTNDANSKDSNDGEDNKSGGRGAGTGGTKFRWKSRR